MINSLFRLFVNKFIKNQCKCSLLPIIPVDYWQLKMPYCTMLFQNAFFLVDLCTHRKPYHVKNMLCSVYFDVYIFYFFLFFVLVSLFCKCSTSTIGKSRLSQRLLWHKLIYFQGKLVNYCSHFFFIPENKMSPNNDIFLKGVLILDFLKNLLASYILWYILIFCYYTLYTLTKA